MTDTYPAFNKIPRWNKDVVITEKIDGTNGLVHIDMEGNVRAGSRSRWLTPGKTSDNYGFAAWVEENVQELRMLGPGYHYGEWYGRGINRNYGLEGRRFALFTQRLVTDGPLPSCVDVVPVLYRGPDLSAIRVTLEIMAEMGSEAVPGFKDPEGIVIRHEASGHLYKVILDKNAPDLMHSIPKGLQAA